MTRDELAAVVAQVKPGDLVRADFETSDGGYSVEGVVRESGGALFVGYDSFRQGRGFAHPHLGALTILDPAVPPEPPIGSVAVWWDPGHSRVRAALQIADGEWAELYNYIGVPLSRLTEFWPSHANLPGLVVVEPLS